MLSGPILELLQQLSERGGGIEDLMRQVNAGSPALSGELAGLEQLVPGAAAGAHNTIPELGNIPGTDVYNPIPEGTFPNYGFEGEHDFFRPGRLSGLDEDDWKKEKENLLDALGSGQQGGVGGGAEGNGGGITGSYLSGAGGDRGGDYAPSLQQHPATQTDLRMLGMFPGGGIVSGYTNLMQHLGNIGIVGGSSTPIPGTQEFTDITDLGDIAALTRDYMDAGMSREDAETQARQDLGSGAPDDIGFHTPSDYTPQEGDFDLYHGGSSTDSGAGEPYTGKDSAHVSTGQPGEPGGGEDDQW